MQMQLGALLALAGKERHVLANILLPLVAAKRGADNRRGYRGAGLRAADGARHRCHAGGGVGGLQRSRFMLAFNGEG